MGGRSVEVISVEPTDGSWPVVGRAPASPEELGAWVARHLGVEIGDRAIVDGHSTPLEYLAHAFFEGGFARLPEGGWEAVGESARRSPDCVVWASRGGGKTFLGAVATLLDLAFKPGVQARILAGSLEQSQRMHEHLRSLLGRPGMSGLLEAKVTMRSVRLKTGSAAQVLAASQRSVRGTRVQKLRCDEVDLFDPELWRAAQLVTRSMAPAPGPWGTHVRGSVEALSTMHRAHGLMWGLVEAAREDRREGGWPVFRWGVVDVLERCPDERRCDGCPLWPECAGRAKDASRRAGHVRIDDALRQKSRVDRATWECEMLCHRPRTTHAVFPEFDRAAHVVSAGDGRLTCRRVVGWCAAMDFGVRSESVVLLASVDDAGVIVVERESAAIGQPVVEQVAVLRGWLAEGACADGELMLVAIDPAGFNRSDQTGVSNARVLREAGWRVRGPCASVQTGLRLVRRRLAAADGRPATLMIHGRCRRLIECVQRYHYPENDPTCGEPSKDGFDHACDALRYLVAAIDGGPGVSVRQY